MQIAVASSRKHGSDRGGHTVATAHESPKHRKVKRVSIEPSANGGFIAEVEHAQPKGRSGMPISYESPQKHALADYPALEKMINHHFAGPAHRMADHPMAAPSEGDATAAAAGGGVDAAPDESAGGEDPDDNEPGAGEDGDEADEGDQD